MHIALAPLQPPCPFCPDPVVAKNQMSRRCTLPQHPHQPPHLFHHTVLLVKIQMSKRLSIPQHLLQPPRPSNPNMLVAKNQMSMRCALPQSPYQPRCPFIRSLPPQEHAGTSRAQRRCTSTSFSADAPLSPQSSPLCLSPPRRPLASPPLAPARTPLNTRQSITDEGEQTSLETFPPVCRGVSSSTNTHLTGSAQVHC